MTDITALLDDAHNLISDALESGFDALALLCAEGEGGPPQVCKFAPTEESADDQRQCIVSTDEVGMLCLLARADQLAKNHPETTYMLVGMVELATNTPESRKG